ncbi:alpha-amylase [Streptoalloteichus tenebrarius]|uniref:Alpha-amylase n=1 Tax=Streptoalloteichus tenebrarius (strain ATCC 17920 / DSM 40477 / JCM 4838 / CBS 697.72 / NBRC 16177 / NCIMB 11028 / NRRL B-12390 / A12253. 1 / ISP 5477) TaxID=1933 RepID=A0ABT1HYE5_STRSD|nr:alpha-amylase family protein [Streptoalloteichus tenebrarius]MCP2260557.1 alpha-amylase [Streptoalloteichus tenebrarius]BFF01899.1 carbohydrate-binding module family 20 domain-containing protein [Streptoalloteichus tenebrarius]
MKRRRVLTLITLLVAGVAAAPPVLVAAEPRNGRDVIVQLFQWNWASVARECRDVLGPRGYGAVQVSPPQEHVVVAGRPWWQDYQPVSYRIDSRRGDREAFRSMVDTCHAAGVRVYVDVVINHMTGQETPGVGSAGSRYSHYEYPGIYRHQDFHHCGRHGDDDIRDYRDRYEVQNCELVNLADLDTAADRVRDRVAGHLNDLLGLGVDGFRVDAAKHVPASDIAAITRRLDRPAHVYQEVIPGAGEPITPEEYTANGDLLEFRYGADLARIFNRERLASLRAFGAPLPSDKVVVFTDNHDTQRHSPVLTFRDNARYAMANAFMLAWPYGTPKVMSSYEYADPDQGPPADASGRTSDTTCFTNRWRCEHRWQVIANMVAFHNVVRGEPVTNWWDNGNDLIAFGRGSRGYLILNDENAGVTGRSYQTSLPAGTYCDVIHGDFTAGRCTGPTYVVDRNGWFGADVAAQDGIALHVGAKVN